MFVETGCDGIMIGRAAQGNPFLFEQIVSYLETGEMAPPPTKEHMRDTILRHMELQMKYKGEYTAVREMRKHIAWYSSGLPHSARLRQKVNEIESMDELKDYVISVLFSHTM